MYTVEQESGILLSHTIITLCLVILIHGLITKNVAFLYRVTVWRRKKPKWLLIYIYFTVLL